VKHSRLAGLSLLFLSMLGLALSAATATAATQRSASRAETQLTTLSVGFAVKKFFVQGNALRASGDAIAIYTGSDGTKQITKQPFVTVVKSIKPVKLGTVGAATSIRRIQSATRVCDVLNLNLGPLHLELLGLIVDLDKVVLTIKADSNGGLLGSLLCGGLGGITGGTGLVPSQTAATTAAQLTQAAKQSGLAAGPGFQIPLTAAAGSATVRTLQALPPVPTGVCTVLDLPLGPIDLNLLGLMVHLDATELRITADPTKGLLGSLLCGGLGGLTTATAAVPTATPAAG